MLARAAPACLSVADAHGMLPSHYAVLRNAHSILSLLVKQPGAFLADGDGMTPLHYGVLHVRSQPSLHTRASCQNREVHPATRLLPHERELVWCRAATTRCSTGCARLVS